MLPVLFMLVSNDIPSVLYPLPVFVVLPAFFGLHYAAAAVPALLFFMWNPGLFRGDTKVPRRSYILLKIATLLTPVWLALGWKDGLEFQGRKYNYSVLAINVCWLFALWAMSARTRKAQPSFSGNLLFHWLLFAWLAWYAFPYLGELP